LAQRASVDRQAHQSLSLEFSFGQGYLLLAQMQ